MGAHEIEGASVANSIYNLACQEGLLTPPARRNDSSRTLWCTSDGRGVDVPVSLTAYHTFRQIENEANQLFTMGCGKAHGSLMQFLTLRIVQELQSYPEDQRYDASRVMFGLTNCLRARCGDDLTKVSADNYGSYIHIPGGNVSIPLGFVGVLAPILRELPDCAVRYTKPVSNIKWGTANQGGPRVIARCCDGEEFSADYCIVTVSLGVLKQNFEKLFCPQLPKDKVDAISKIGYGQVDKIFLEYSRPFWLWHEGGVSFGWSHDELNNRKDWTRGLCHIEEVEGSKHVLCAYVSGDEALQMEKATDEEVAEGVTRVLRQFTGDASLPFPSTILRSKWASDPYFCGSHSYLGLTSNVGHQCDLSCPLPGLCDPIPPILMFAGEATCAGHYSTCHGARLSGIREAERIIQLTQRFGGPPPKS